MKKRLIVIIALALNLFLTPSFSTAEANEKLPNPTVQPQVQQRFKNAIKLSIAGMLDKALNEYLQIINLDPYYAQAYNNIGFIYRQKGKTDKALEYYHKALSLNPKDDTAHTNIASCHDSRGDLDKAIESYMNALKIDPGSITVELALEKILKKKAQKLGKSLEEVQEELALHYPSHKSAPSYEKYNEKKMDSKNVADWLDDDEDEEEEEDGNSETNEDDSRSPEHLKEQAKTKPLASETVNPKTIKHKATPEVAVTVTSTTKQPVQETIKVTTSQPISAITVKTTTNKPAQSKEALKVSTPLKNTVKQPATAMSIKVIENKPVQKKEVTKETVNNSTVKQPVKQANTQITSKSPAKSIIQENISVLQNSKMPDKNLLPVKEKPKSPIVSKITTQPVNSQTKLKTPAVSEKDKKKTVSVQQPKKTTPVVKTTEKTPAKATVNTTKLPKS